MAAQDEKTIKQKAVGSSFGAEQLSTKKECVLSMRWNYKNSYSYESTELSVASLLQK